MIIPDEENLTFLFENFNIDDKNGNESKNTSSTASEKEILNKKITKSDNLTINENGETITEKGPIPTYNRTIVSPYSKSLTFQNKFSKSFVNNTSSNNSNLNIVPHINVQNYEDSNSSVHAKPNYDDIDQEVIKEIVCEHEKIADQMINDKKGIYNLCNLMFSNEDYSLNELNQTLSNLEDLNVSFSTSSNNKEYITEQNKLIELENSVDTSSLSTSISNDSFDISYLDDTRSIFDDETKIFFNKNDRSSKIKENLIDLKDIDSSCSTFSSKDDEFVTIVNESSELKKDAYSPSTSPSNNSSDINYSEIIQCKMHHSRNLYHVESKFEKPEINNNVQVHKFEKLKHSTLSPLKQENKHSVLIPNLPIFNPVPSRTKLEGKMCSEKKKQIWVHVSNMSITELTKVVCNNETFLVHLLKSQSDYKLEKIYAVVERLKSEKCLNVPSKNHEKSILYNAIIYCNNEPLVARYIAETLIDANIDINKVYEGKTLLEFITMKHNIKYDAVCNEILHLIKN